jgi:EthD domain
LSGWQPKLIYFGPFEKGRERGAFRARWRQHAKLAETLPFWDLIPRYTQFDVLDAAETGGVGTALGQTDEDRFGGVGAIWYESAAALATIPDDPGLETMRTDEREVFGEELLENFFTTREHAFLDSGESAVTLIALLHRAPGISREEFQARWREQGRRLTPTLSEHADTWIQNEASAEWPSPPNPDADGILELGFPSLSSLFEFFQTSAAAQEVLAADFIDGARSIRVLTKENRLLSPASAPAAGTTKTG